jgi:hypothetical protein
MTINADAGIQLTKNKNRYQGEYCIDQINGIKNTHSANTANRTLKKSFIFFCDVFDCFFFLQGNIQSTVL